MWLPHSYALKRVHFSLVVRAGDFDIILGETFHQVGSIGIFDAFGFP